MNYIYDLVLNFNNSDNFLEFYEWNKFDKLINVTKIPIYKVDSFQMSDFINKKIVFYEEILEEVGGKTISDDGSFNNCFLVTDLNRVIALSIDDSGRVRGISSLLLDEEDAVIDEVMEYSNTKLKYKIIDSYKRDIFLTREERMIQKRLISELKDLYKNGNYDEIRYLYEELYDDNICIDEAFKFLVNDISNNYNSKYNKLYEIIRMT